MNKLVAIALLTAGGYAIRKQMKKSEEGRLSSVTESIEVDVPVSTAYNQWTQFEDFPKFMAGVLEVRQLDDTHLHWRAEIAGKEEQWDSEITQQVPDKLIAWRSTSGVRNDGTVTFRKISDSRTAVEFRSHYQPRGLIENIGDALGVVSMRAKGNLQRFKEFLESRGRETGAWRGSVGAGGSTGSSGGSGSGGSMGAGGSTGSGGLGGSAGSGGSMGAGGSIGSGGLGGSAGAGGSMGSGGSSGLGGSSGSGGLTGSAGASSGSTGLGGSTGSGGSRSPGGSGGSAGGI
jgi:uncharacterized membrane protein